MPHTSTCLSTVRFSENYILKVIRKLDPRKAHGHDEINTRLLKLSDKAIYKPFHIIFTSCLETGVFPIHWKKANFAPINKNESKQSFKNHKPVSRLRIKLLFPLINFSHPRFCNQVFYPSGSATSNDLQQNGLKRCEDKDST